LLIVVIRLQLVLLRREPKIGLDAAALEGAIEKKLRKVQEVDTAESIDSLEAAEESEEPEVANGVK